ncbi:MAG: hypothetical protein ACRCX2_33980 [Paraclostridium sp.]
MNSAYYQAAEGILYSYGKVRSYVGDLEYKLKEVESTEWSNIKSIQYDKICSRVFGISSATENSVITKMNLIDSIKKDIKNNEKFCNDIDNAIKNLSSDEKRMIKLLYFKAMDKNKAMKILNLKKDKFYGLKNQAIKDFATAWFGIKAIDDTREENES